MKKVFLALLVLALFSFAACDNGSPAEQTTSLTSESYTETPSSETITQIEEQESTKKSIDFNKVIENSVLGIEIPLIPFQGDAEGELLERLEKLGISIIKNENGSDVFFQPDPNDARMYFGYKTEPMAFYFDRSAEFVRITVKDPSIATEKGIRIGDSFDKVKEVYGEPDLELPDGKALCYTNGSIYLEFINGEDLTNSVAVWNICSLKSSFFDDAYRDAYRD
jgi:hypothetical protein